MLATVLKKTRLLKIIIIIIITTTTTTTSTKIAGPEASRPLILEPAIGQEPDQKIIS
jgi:hypothetical protein